MKFDFFKKNWIGAALGLVIGIMNLGVKYVSKLLHKISLNVVDLFVKSPPCDCGGILGCMCPDIMFPEMYTRYTILTIGLLIVLGAFIQSKMKL